MALTRLRLQILMVLPLLAGLLTGCPQSLPPQLLVSPGSIDFSTDGINRALVITNLGQTSLQWTAQEVVRASEDADWVAGDVPWLSLSATLGTTSKEVDHIGLVASRTGQAVGIYVNSGVRITSNGGTVVVPISMEVQNQLTVTPSAISLSATDTTARFQIFNGSPLAINWAINFVANLSQPGQVSAVPSNITLSPALGTTATGESTTVNVTLPPGGDDFGLLVESSIGTALVTFSIGSPLNFLSVTPSTLLLHLVEGQNDEGDPLPQPEATLNIRHMSGGGHLYTLELVNLDNAAQSVPISLSSSFGSLAPNETDAIKAKVTDPENILKGSNNYQLIVRSEGAFIIVPIVVDVLPVPIIAISSPPSTEVFPPRVTPIETLDFGREETQLTFYVANTGPTDSLLFFKITHEDERAANPVIAAVAPVQGNTNGPDSDFFSEENNTPIDGVPITVTINRNNLREDVELRTLTVTAFDSSFSTAQAAVEPAELVIRVERQPLQVEGTLNRSRPPYVMRFVFLVRDSLGQVVPTQTEEERKKLQFVIFEDDVALDLNETNQFLTNELQVNLAILLDYTGSMLNAGTADPVNGLERGEAVSIMKAATRRFIDDLPPSYRVALLFYNNVQQPNRVIHQFTTDRESLKAALDAFTLPEAQFGTSDINDALLETMELLEAEDPPETLPFDDADVRAIVYVTDGEDNASVATLSDVTTTAEESRVRLYPVSYSPNGETVNTADLITVSRDSGGHLYTAGTAEGLTAILGGEKSLVLDSLTMSGANTASFQIHNMGASSFSFNVRAGNDTEFVTGINPSSGNVSPGNSQTITVNLDPTDYPALERTEGEILITSGAGTGSAVIQFTPNIDNSLAEDISVALRDEPGTLWRELQNQIVLTYITPKQTQFEYAIIGRYTQPNGEVIEGPFMRDGVFFPGDVLGGQISLKSTGIIEDLRTTAPDQRFRAEVFMNTDYIPRNVNRLRVRFYTGLPEDVPASFQTALDGANVQVEIAPDGLLATQGGWRLVPESDGVYFLVTNEENPLPFGSFGSLLQITYSNLQDYVALFDDPALAGRNPEFLLYMRVDNPLLVEPASGGKPSDSKYFLYPGERTNPDRPLSIQLGRSDIASPARDLVTLQAPGINPEREFEWDRDSGVGEEGDGIPDFNDPAPDDPDFPDSFVVPNPFEIAANRNSFTLTITNNRLETFTWALETDELPTWIVEDGITYGAGNRTEPRSSLAPGESETLNIPVDRTGIPTRNVPGILTFTTDLEFKPVQEVAVTLIVVLP
ncbi:MAG: hypothetical protein HYV27_02150 [Candidatus Hydrogenedentes bacterium]|nr:hypothetical protein [Candidatus Hydrogenedentota bacterium]